MRSSVFKEWEEHRTLGFLRVTLIFFLLHLPHLQRPVVQFKAAGVESFKPTVLWSQERGRKPRTLLVLLERREGDLVIPGEMAERDLTVCEYLRNNLG